MKAERRHELRENDLLHTLESARDYVSENGSRIAVTVVVILAIVAAISFGIRSRAAAYEDIWRRKAELSFQEYEPGRESLAALAALRQETSDTAFILQSLVDQGRHALRLSQQAPSPPDMELNDVAREAFEKLLAQFPENPLAVGVARLGLATVAENAFAADQDPTHKETAEGHLRSVVENSLLNGLPFQKMAIDRLARLDETFNPVVYEPAPVAPAEVDPPQPEVSTQEAAPMESGSDVDQTDLP